MDIVHDATDIALCEILAGPCLRFLRLDYTNREQRPGFGVLRGIFSRTPRLRRIHIFANVSLFDGYFPKSLGGAMSNLKLEELSLSLFMYIPRFKSIIREIGSALPVTHLDVEQFNSDASWATETGLKKGSFASLTSLEIFASFAGISLCFPEISGLTKLNVRSKWPEEASTVNRLLGSASQYLPSLNTLYITCDGLVNEGPLTFAMLGQYSVVSRLITFKLRWPTALRGSINNLVSHMPDIVHLDLNAYPDNGEPELTLDVLSIFANRCHKLRDLYLFIDCRVPPAIETWADERAINSSALEMLDLGISPFNMGEPQAFASWLNRLLPKTCSVFIPGLPSERKKVEKELERLRGTTD